MLTFFEIELILIETIAKIVSKDRHMAKKILQWRKFENRQIISAYLKIVSSIINILGMHKVKHILEIKMYVF